MVEPLMFFHLSIFIFKHITFLVYQLCTNNQKLSGVLKGEKKTTYEIFSYIFCKDKWKLAFHLLFFNQCGNLANPFFSYWPVLVLQGDLRYFWRIRSRAILSQPGYLQEEDSSAISSGLVVWKPISEEEEWLNPKHSTEKYWALFNI